VDFFLLSFLFFLSFFFLVKLAFKIRTSYLQSMCSTSQIIPAVHFALVILEMESHKLFALVGLKWQSFLSQPPKYLGLQVWDTHTGQEHC
jgi:hypothetical protein